MTDASDAGIGSGPRGGLGFLLGALFLNSLAGGVIVPILPRLLLEVRGDQHYDAALWLGVFLSTFALAQFFAAPVLGALSDRFGRRPIILLSSLGMAIDFFIMALAPNLAILLVGRIIGGAMAGGWAACMAYFSDITPDEHRARRLGYFGAAVGAGALLAPVFGGLLGEIDLRAPFWAAGAVSLAATAYGVWVLPESLPMERRAPLRFGHLHPIGVARELLNDYPSLLRWAGVFALVIFGSIGAHSILPLYATLRFGWSPGLIGAFGALLAATNIAVQALLVGRLVRRFGEARTMLGGLSLQALGLLIICLAPGSAFLWLGGVVMVAGSLAIPAFNAIVNRRVAEGDRGRLAGASSALSSIVSIASPPLFAGLLGASVGQAAGIGFGLAALFVVSGIVLASLGFEKDRRRASAEAT